MTHTKIDRPDIQDEDMLDRELVTFSKAHPDKWLTYWATFGHVRFVLHDRKPQSTAWGEDCYRQHGGFFKNGQIHKPSKTWLRQFNACPVQH